MSLGLEEPMTLQEHLVVAAVVLVIYVPGLLLTWRIYRKDHAAQSSDDSTDLTASNPDDWEDSDEMIDDSDLMCLAHQPSGNDHQIPKIE